MFRPRVAAQPGLSIRVSYALDTLNFCTFYLREAGSPAILAPVQDLLTLEEALAFSNIRYATLERRRRTDSLLIDSLVRFGGGSFRYESAAFSRWVHARGFWGSAT